MQNLMKILLKREIGKAEERIKAFKKGLQETMTCWLKDEWSRLSNTENKAFLLSMQNDRTASIAGKDIKTHKLEMRQQKQKLRSDLNEQEEMRKHEEAAVAMLANSSDDQRLHLLVQMIVMKRLFVFGLVKFFFVSNECYNTCLLVGNLLIGLIM